MDKLDHFITRFLCLVLISSLFLMSYAWFTNPLGLSAGSFFGSLFGLLGLSLLGYITLIIKWDFTILDELSEE